MTDAVLEQRAKTLGDPTIVIGRPPLFDLIDATFNIKGVPVIFAWGNTIYNPKGYPLPQHLIAHEAIHCVRQGDDIEGWWHRYCDDRQFRLDEEIVAHRFEFRTLLRLNGDVRNNRRVFLGRTAAKLANPLYGKLISLSEAKKVIAA